MTEQAVMDKATFVERAITRLRNQDKSNGIHSVYSGFNGAYVATYGVHPKDDADFQEMLTENLFTLIPRKGGPMLYLAGEAPKNSDSGSNKALSIITAE